MASITQQLKEVTQGQQAESSVEPRLDVTADFRSAQRDTGMPTTEVGSGNGDAAISLEAGSMVGRYQIQHPLGAGGMGTVYQATDSNSGQQVALKLLSKNVRTTDETVQRFQRESQIAASINHPRSTFVYTAGQHEGQFYITMELMTGGTLDDIVKADGPLDVGRAVDHVIDMIDGLLAAHEVGIVHRDLKPSNCFIDQTGRVKIGDFGLAKSFLNDSSLTQTGAFMGTPQYAAPEQLRTSEVDERADIYAIGGTLFYLLLGRPPFVGNAAQVISSIASETPPRACVLDKSIPRQLSRIIDQTLEKKPERRPENLEQLRQALLPFSTRGSTPADVGRRMAAFFLDTTVIGILIAFGSNVLGVCIQLFPSFDINLASLILSFSLGVLYFWISEFWFSKTLGKWLLGMRVTTFNNRSPSLASCLVRATLMPGLMYLAHSAPPYVLGVDPTGFDPTAADAVDALIKTASVIILFQLAGWLVAAALFVTARKTNGFLGLHETLSGTRVVRVSGTLESRRFRNIPVTVPISATVANAMRADDADATYEFVSPEMSGDFKIVGELGRLGESSQPVHLARDESLDRDVWVFTVPEDSPFHHRARKSISRPSRVRVLDHHGDQSTGKTMITEAVKGMPMTEYLRLSPNLDWRSFRPVLEELVIELDRSMKDDSLPENLCLAQVWLDETGHAKLLEYPVNAIASGLQPNDPLALDRTQSKPDQSAWNNETTELEPNELIKAILNVFVRHQVAPAHVLTFREEIDVLMFEDEPMQRIAERLQELAEMPSAWRWDDRLGVLAVSAGLEMSIASSLLIVVAMLSSLLELNPLLSGFLMFTLSSVIAILLGVFTNGGPVFQISGVMVRENKTLNPASKLRIAMRTWVAWLPLTLTVTLLGIIISSSVSEVHHATETQEASISLMTILATLTFLMLAPMTLLAAGYNILKPSRGLQDLVCGTRLIRK